MQRASVKLNCLTVGKHPRTICSRCDCPRHARGRNRIGFPATIDFSGRRCIAALHKAHRVLCARATAHYCICAANDTSRSIAFVLFAIKSCINWRRLVYFWLFEKRFCRYAIVIRYNRFAYSSKYGKKYRERVTYQ